MRHIPLLKRIDVIFGNIDHLPKMSEIPEQFQRRDNPYVEFVSSWFYGGRSADDIRKLKARDGVNRDAALAAVKAILASFDPKHEHKTAGAAYLLCEWFELDGAKVSS